MNGQDFLDQFLAPSADDNPFKALTLEDVRRLAEPAEWDPWS